MSQCVGTKRSRVRSQPGRGWVTACPASWGASQSCAEAPNLGQTACRSHHECLCLATALFQQPVSKHPRHTRSTSLGHYLQGDPNTLPVLDVLPQHVFCTVQPSSGQSRYSWSIAPLRASIYRHPRGYTNPTYTNLHLWKKFCKLEIRGVFCITVRFTFLSYARHSGTECLRKSGSVSTQSATLNSYPDNSQHWVSCN